MRDTFGEDARFGSKPEGKAPYNHPELPLDEALVAKLHSDLDFTDRVVLDPSALPFLPELVEYTKLRILIPRVLYQLLSVSRNEIPPVHFSPGGPHDANRPLIDVALSTLSPWIAGRRPPRWDLLRHAMASERCRPVWPITDPGMQLLRRSLVVSRREATLEIDGIESPNLVGLTLGQELAAAAENSPILAARPASLLRLASSVLFTKLVGGARSYDAFVNAKQVFFNRWLAGLPRKTVRLRWGLAAVLFATEAPGVTLPLSLDVAIYVLNGLLLVVDP